MSKKRRGSKDLPDKGFDMDAPRVPEGWGQDPLSEFIDLAHRNTLGSFTNYSGWFSLLRHIDAPFHTLTGNMTNISPPIVAFLFMRASAAYRASVRLATSGQHPEAYSLLRGVLEYSIYAFHLYKHPQSVQTWLDRDQDEETKKKVMKEFRPSNLLAELKAGNAWLGGKTRELYEFTITSGAHPNPRATIAALEDRSSAESITYDLNMLDQRRLQMVVGFKRTAQVGLCSLKIFEMIFPERFALLGLSEAIEQLRHATVDGVPL